MPIKGRPSSLRNEQGGILTVVTIVVFVLVAGLFYISGILNDMYNQELTNYYKRRIEITRNSMMAYIRSDAAWAVTISKPGNASAGFGCLATKTCTTTLKPFKLFDANGTKLSDPNDPSFGMDINGNPCSGFSVTNPDKICVMRFDFSWAIDCTSCVHQAPRVIGTVTLAVDNKKVVVNTNPLGIDFARGKELGTIGETCASLKGKFNSTTGQCELPFIEVPCTTASSMNGTLSNGEVNCEQSPGFGLQNCPSNKKPVGINAKGEIICEPR